MYCTKCGNKLTEDAKFCTQCGAETNKHSDNDRTVTVDLSNYTKKAKAFYEKHERKFTTIFFIVIISALIIFGIKTVFSPANMLRTTLWYCEPDYSINYSGLVYGRGEILEFISDYDLSGNIIYTEGTCYETDYVYNQDDEINVKKISEAKWTDAKLDLYSPFDESEWEILEDNTLVFNDIEYEWKTEWYVTPTKLIIGDTKYSASDKWGYN